MSSVWTPRSRVRDVALPQGATCLELGCGVGRITAWLARRCGHVMATDISASHLALARDASRRAGRRNVEFHRLARIETIDALPAFDLFFSVIVLQHNPPPVIRAILDACSRGSRRAASRISRCRRIVPATSSAFDAYLRDEVGKGEMEMHVLPQSAILRAASEHGLELLEVIEDPYTGMRAGEVSNTFLFRKRESA